MLTRLVKQINHPYFYLVLATLLGAFVGSKWNVPLAAWLAPIFLVRFLRSQSSQSIRRGFLLAWLLKSLAGYVALKGFVPLPDPFFFGFIFVLMLSDLVPYLADRIMAPRLGGLLGTLVLPTATVSWAYFNALISPYGSWGAVAYTQVENLGLLQSVSVLGMWGIFFLIYWSASMVNWMWEQGVATEQTEWGALRRGVMLYVGILAGLLLLGEARLAFSAPTVETVRVAAIVPSNQPLQDLSMLPRLITGEPVSDAEIEHLRIESASLNDDLFQLTQREAQNGAKLIFWPEASGFILADEQEALIARAQELARQEQIYLGMGLGIVHPNAGERHENKLVLIDPTGQVSWQYDKSKPVAFGEEPFFVRGDGQMPILDTPYGRIAGAICHDMDHHEFILQAGDANVDLLFIPTGDWEEIARMHLNMTIMRAVEHGITIVRPTRGGISAAIDPQGRLISTMDRADIRFGGTPVGTLLSSSVLLAEVPTTGMSTPYSTIKDAFAWLNVLAFFALIASLLVQRVRVKPVPEFKLSQNLGFSTRNRE